MTGSVSQWVCLLVVSGCSVSDLLCRRIPNWITVPAVIGAIVFNVMVYGWTDGLMRTSVGFAMGCGLVLFPFLMGAMGAGDVKLLGAIGAWTGSIEVLNVFIYSAWAGTLWALVMMLGNKSLQPTIRRLWEDFLRFRLTGRLRLSSASGATMPYAVAFWTGYLVFLFYGRFI